MSFLPRDNDNNWGRCTLPCVSFGIGWCPAQPGIPECEKSLGTLGCAVATDCSGWGGTEAATSCCSIEGGDSKGGENIKNNICLPMVAWTLSYKCI